MDPSGEKPQTIRERAPVAFVSFDTRDVAVTSRADESGGELRRRLRNKFVKEMTIA